jgi:hypothetical protein
VLNEAVAHLLCQHSPFGNKSLGRELVASPKLIEDDVWQNGTQLLKSARSGQFGDGFAELSSGRTVGGHVEELVFEAGDIDAQDSLLCTLSVLAKERRKAMRRR